LIFASSYGQKLHAQTFFKLFSIAKKNFFSERRRSERVKREKPDYYDALEFENKRKTSTPTRDK
jgi:hypothetical protein